MNISARECKNCNKTFIPKKIGKNHKGVFCSRECNYRYKHAKRYGVCLTCDKSFFKHFGPQQIYCSHKCSVLTGNKSHSWQGGKTDITPSVCIACNATYFRKKNIVGKYCSRNCAHQDLNKNYIADKNPNYRGGKYVPCKTCGSLIWEIPCLKRSFCSKGCMYKNKTFRSFNSVKSGKRPDLGDIYFRSSWEANYARYLNFLVDHKQIVKWTYEEDTFEFKTIRKGTRFYTPDFKIYHNNGKIEYHEVKGFMDSKSITRHKRMTKYYPDIIIKIIDSKKYYALSSKVHGLIPNWENQIHNKSGRLRLSGRPIRVNK